MKKQIICKVIGQDRDNLFLAMPEKWDEGFEDYTEIEFVIKGFR